MAVLRLGDGIDYELDLDFELGEAMTIQEYTGKTLDLVKINSADIMVMASLVHIAIRRRFPDVDEDAIRKRVRLVKLSQVTLDLREDEQDPTVTPTASEKDSGNAPTGPPSNGDGDDSQVTPPVATGQLH